MKKILMIALCLGLVPMLFADNATEILNPAPVVGCPNPTETYTMPSNSRAWFFYDDGVASNAWAWYDPGNGWGNQFPMTQAGWIDSIAAYIWPSSWPSPGGNTATFQLWTGASSPTTMLQEWSGVTIVRGDWNYFEADTTLTGVSPGDNIYLFYIQDVAYPNCPGMAVDAAVNAPAGMLWYFFGGSFGQGNSGGDWMLRVNHRMSAGVYHDVSCSDIVSPPAGSVSPGNYDVTGRIRNFGTETETFDVTAHVFDTTDMTTPIFDQTVTLTNFPSGGDSNVTFAGQVTFDPDSWYYTEIFTLLAGDENTGNDTSSIYSTTAMSLGDVIYELDIEAAVGGDQYLVGLEFDGDYFYVTSGSPTLGPQLYVVDTAGTMIWQFNQPGHSTGWGWRDIAWDNTYLGADQIDTLWSSVNTNADKWSVDLQNGQLIYHGFEPGPANPNRAMAWHDDNSWFFTANWDPCTKFDKDNPNIQTVAGPGSVYGAAYDTDLVDGGWVWWHSQNDPGTGILCQIDQMEPVAMTWTGLTFGYIPTMSTGGIAGGMSFHEGFRNSMDVLFCLVQGTPDQICGVYVRDHDPGIEEQDVSVLVSIGFAPNTPTLVNSRVAISYTTSAAGNVSLKVYDGAGRLVETLVNSRQQAGANTVTWNNDNLSNGVYFFNLEVEETTATHKLILVK